MIISVEMDVPSSLGIIHMTVELEYLYGLMDSIHSLAHSNTLLLMFFIIKWRLLFL